VHLAVRIAFLRGDAVAGQRVGESAMEPRNSKVEASGNQAGPGCVSEDEQRTGRAA
jgi:hypothetical protein